MMTNLPIVSICIPTYNAGEFFEACLQSALSQTYMNVEILISDDGSSDDTLKIAEQYQKQFSHIRLVQNASGGMVNNWNNCIEEAKGEWIKFLFQDDVLKPDCIEKMLSVCLTYNVDIGLCRREFIIHNDVPKIVRINFKYVLIRPERVFDDLTYISPQQLAEGVSENLRQNILGEPTCYLFHKRIFAHTGMFNKEYKQVVDYEFIIRLGLKRGLAFTNEVLALFRVHNKSESSANSKINKAMQSKHIAAVTGDQILLLYNFLHNPEFELIKQKVGADNLALYIKYLYYSGCKHKGRRLLNKAIEPIRTKYKEIGGLNYNLFKYIYYRKLFKKWEKQLRNS
jgi:glycosyltransferase involved in cell wall biosynthesis